MIKSATTLNIMQLLFNILKFLQSNPQLCDGVNDWDLETIIFYINYTTFKLNLYINNYWESGKLTTYFPPLIKINIIKYVYHLVH